MTHASEWLERSKQYSKKQEAMGRFLRHLKPKPNEFLFGYELRAKLIADRAIESTSKSKLTAKVVEIARTKLGLEVTTDTTYGEAATMFMETNTEKRSLATVATGEDGKARASAY